MRQLTLAGTVANTATCSYLPWWRARAAPLPWAWFFATFWSFLSENHHAAAYNTSWTLLSSQSRPSSWSSCPSPGPHWSVVCSLKAHSSNLRHSMQLNDKTFNIGILRRRRRRRFWVNFFQTSSAFGDPLDLSDHPLLLDIFSLGPPQLRTGLGFLFSFKVSFEKHPNDHSDKKDEKAETG